MDIFDGFDQLFPAALAIAAFLVLFYLSARLKLAASPSHIQLALRSYSVSHDSNKTDQPLLHIVGRRSGIISWLLTVLDIDLVAQLVVTRWQVFVRASYINGEACQTIPLPRVASVSGGAYRSIAYLVMAFVCVLIGGIDAWQSARYTAFIASGVIGVAFLILFYLRRRLYLSFESVGGALLTLTFSPSVIEGVSIDFNKITDAIECIDDALLKAAQRK